MTLSFIIPSVTPSSFLQSSGQCPQLPSLPKWMWLSSAFVEHQNFSSTSCRLVQPSYLTVWVSFFKMKGKTHGLPLPFVSPGRVIHSIMEKRPVSHSFTNNSLLWNKPVLVSPVETLLGGCSRDAVFWPKIYHYIKLFDMKLINSAQDFSMLIDLK